VRTLIKKILDFDYDGQRYYYGFSFEHKKLKTEENRNLTFISPLDHDTTSIYEIESHFQTNRFKISPFVRVADFYEEQGPDDEGNYQKENFNILMPGLKFKPIGFNALHKYQKNRNKQGKRFTRLFRLEAKSEPTRIFLKR
jgi:hypothetical protein